MIQVGVLQPYYSYSSLHTYLYLTVRFNSIFLTNSVCAVKLSYCSHFVGEIFFTNGVMTGNDINEGLNWRERALDWLIHDLFMLTLRMKTSRHHAFLLLLS